MRRSAEPAPVAPPRRIETWTLAVGLAAALLYLPTVGFGFVWDDHELVAPSPALVSLGGLAKAMGTDLYRASDPTLPPSDYYRPVALASYYANARLPMDTAHALHLGNVVLHALSAGLLALLLLRRLAPGTPFAVPLIAAAWWALHPEQVETVAWISARYDLLCAVAALGVLLCRPEGGRGAAARGTLVLAGLFSKEGFIAVVAVIAVDDWAARRPWRTVLPSWLAITGALVTWAVLRAGIGISSPGHADLASPAHYLTAVGTYLGRALAPLPLTISHPYARWGAPGLVAVAALLVVSVAAARRWRDLATPVALFLVPLGPVAMAAAGLGSTAERYFYLPSLGLAWLAAALLSRAALAQRPALRALPAAVALLTVLGGASSFLRLADWRSDRALFEAAVAVDPDDWMANLSLGRTAVAAGDLDTALERLGRAQRRNPTSAKIANALAAVHLRREDAPALLAQALLAVRLDPGFPQAWVHLAAAHHLTGDHASERRDLDEALRLAPRWPEVAALRSTAPCLQASAVPAAAPLAR